jgi:adenylylsulfate kinase
MKDTCHENHGRSITKAISYRVVSIIADLALVFILTRKIELTLGIVLLSNTASVFIYYFHERAWNTIHLGRRPKAQ